MRKWSVVNRSRSFSPRARSSPRRVERACTDQTFELPGRPYAAMALIFTGFIAVLAMVLHGGHLAVAFGVIFAFIAAYFARAGDVPADAGKKALSWDEFGERGIMTATGHSTCA